MKIYCDGACSGNPGPGGWSAIILQADSVMKKVYGYQERTTNNRMELIAAIKGLECVDDDVVHVYTDSNYLKLGITVWIKSWKQSNWKNGKIKNIDLWKHLDILNQKKKIMWFWVKAHNGDKYNEMADQFAKLAIAEKKEYEPIVHEKTK